MTYQTGQIVEGKVTGIQPYGAFVSLDKHTSGLIHISEISDGYVRDISRFVQLGDTVRVKIIDYDQKTGQARLSLKALNHTRVRSRRHPVGRIKASLPEMKIGFGSIAGHMPQWIAEASGEGEKK
ncbi:MAG: CvfD/Ygs/GSP13 family RNA-binding post-transcriptional regulator [Solobacterium sp.]|jgi:glucose-6-phosphate isomerase/general stress protein 13|nr:CvfD/Ygs/GSP13 family RNA-binding post-transcriptional regulator [Solobacterium sp.]MCH4222014.1 CvfD/Ygs/GSP13 family RNA-binding post-transcriptional regulator [Solobacterium sp.]MCH4266051.1 CvfD/Ygs/GSP13 family RNA-binding post-transcriptional regulator [Solobacterium sp.]